MAQAGCHPAPGARPQPACELADIVRRYGPAYCRGRRLPLAHLKVLQAIEACRTAALGGHRESCASCGFERYAYNSCRNRHCPKCQSLAKEQWLEARPVRPQQPGRHPRRHPGAAHLGPAVAAALPPALCHPRRRPVVRPPAVAARPPPLPLSGPRPEQGLPRQVPRWVATPL